VLVDSDASTDGMVISPEDYLEIRRGDAAAWVGRPSRGRSKPCGRRAVQSTSGRVMPLRMWCSIGLTVVLVSVPGALMAQDSGSPGPDSAELRRRLRVPPLSIERASVIAFGTALADSSDAGLGAWRAVAKGLGFDFRMVIGPAPIVIDVPANAVHYVPPGVRAGFVLVVPERRSDLIRGLVSPDSLEHRMRAYLAAVRPFRR
jgi:hypothetical protein